MVILGVKKGVILVTPLFHFTDFCMIFMEISTSDEIWDLGNHFDRSSDTLTNPHFNYVDGDLTPKSDPKGVILGVIWGVKMTLFDPFLDHFLTTFQACGSGFCLVTDQNRGIKMSHI